VPGFAPDRLLAAWQAAQEGEGDRAALGDILGSVVFPTGCVVDLDYAALWAGEAITADLSAKVRAVADRVVIESLPPASPARVVVQAIEGLFSEHEPAGEWTVEVQQRRGYSESVEVRLSGREDADAFVRHMCAAPPWRREVKMRLPMPLEALLTARVSDTAGDVRALALALRQGA
jgi:hypothetical protein